MADIRDWGAFLRGRWDWKRFGYEKGFPRGCGFTDVDAALEFDGRRLLVETKSWDGIGAVPPLPLGQRLNLEKEAEDTGRTVLVVFGCGCCNDPWAALNMGTLEFHDWRGYTKPERRNEFKALIDKAMGV